MSLRRLFAVGGTALIAVCIIGLALLAVSPSPEVTTEAAPRASEPVPTPVAWEAVAAAPTKPPPTVEPTPQAEAPAFPVLLDEHFADNRMGWRDDSRSTAWFGPREYRLTPRQPGQFVAVAAPINKPLQDVMLMATFRKQGGPLGGGYGLIVRDQSPPARDGWNQNGRYYVLEVGDRGEVGIWRRDEERWTELLPWTRSDTVQIGAATNQLEVWAIGSRLTLLVNGVQVASQVDTALGAGGVGVFAGGDGNDVALQQFAVRTPRDQADAAAVALASSATPEPASPAPRPTLVPEVFHPIRGVRIPRIELDSEAVPAPLVDAGGNLTWQVPSFKIGHAEGTAGAGDAGNAVLVGHVTSRNLGNVFEKLDRVQVGDAVQVLSGDQQFEYTVDAVHTVKRDDVSVVRPTSQPTLTLITCTGVWLPLVSDYSERLVVQAGLSQARAP
jgi:LPXTG-site transpeptidase (sortase) family protein